MTYHDKQIARVITAALLLLIALAVFAQDAPPVPPYGPVVREEIKKNLPPVCLDAEHVGKPANACPSSRQRFSSATQSSLVRVCPTNPESTTTCTDYSTVIWKRFADVQDADDAAPRDVVEVCTADKEEGSVVGGGNCKASSSGSTWSGMKFVPKEAVSHLPPLPPATFTITPAAGVSPLDVTLTWNVPGMTGEYPCTATGDWSGQFAAAHSHTERGVMRSSSYTLTCTHIPPGGALVSWNKPTTNTDGTPLTNASGYVLSYGNSMLQGAPVLSNSVSVPYSQTSYLFSDLLPMRWFFAIQTLNAEGTLSKLSNIVTYDVQPRTAQIQRYTGTVSVTVTQEPAPPDGLSVTKPTTTGAE